MILELEVTFIGGRFRGEAWEWPPSPTRLFQALIAATHYGANGLFHQAARDAALRWLEQLPPPTIASVPASYGADHVENYVPNNDDELGVNAHVRTAKSLALLGRGRFNGFGLGICD